jgi:predicted enzyme related to lactoylglutathione lyase
MFLGLRTVIYPAPDLDKTKAWFAAALGIEPYFDEPFYVGFNVGGYELGLDPNLPQAEGHRAFWGVDDIDAAIARLTDAGATVKAPAQEVGDGIKVATVTDPLGNDIGLIYNPHFTLDG